MMRTRAPGWQGACVTENLKETLGPSVDCSLGHTGAPQEQVASQTVQMSTLSPMSYIRQGSAYAFLQYAL